MFSAPNTQKITPSSKSFHKAYMVMSTRGLLKFKYRARILEIKVKIIGQAKKYKQINLTISKICWLFLSKILYS